MSADATTELLVCGIDVGSTNVKVILVDGRAQTIWTKAIPVPRVIQAGRPVTNAAALVTTLEQMMIEGWREVGATVPLGAIAITGVGEDGVPVSSDLRPLDHAIPWFDRRAEQEAATLRATLGNDVRAGVSIDFSRTAAKWCWLRNNRINTVRDAHLWIALTDYPAVWWSRTPFMSQTLAARTACYDVFAREWIPASLDACGAPPVPKVVAAGTVVGTVSTGALLASGAATRKTLVVAGGHDHPIAASAVRRLNGHALVDSLGTANLMYDEIVRSEPGTDPYIAFSVPALGNPGVSCLGVFEFSASLEPFRAPGSDAELRAFLASAQASGAPASMPDTHEALERALTPDAVSGVSADSRNLRASLDAACLYARCMRDAIQKAGAAASPIFAVGGWARSDALLQLRASAFGAPVSAIEEEELTALGVALIARDALGFGAALAPLVRKTRVIQPIEQWQVVYERNFPEYRSFVKAIKELRAA